MMDWCSVMTVPPRASNQVTAAGRESHLGSCRVAPSTYTSFVIKEENKEGEGVDSHHAEITPTSGTDITAASPPLPPRRSLRKTGMRSVIHPLSSLPFC